jgi:hypothetical protein
MRHLLLLIFAISAAAAPVVTDQFGTAKTSFAPGDAVYIYFPEPGTAQIKIIDAATGAVVLERTIDVKTPGPQLLWQLHPNTAEGTYRIYITFSGQPYVYSITVATPILWQPYLVAAAAAAVAAYILWYHRAKLLPRPHTPFKYRLQLPNNYVVEINTPHAVFGREFFIKLGVPEDVAKYISRNHFAIYAERRAVLHTRRRVQKRHMAQRKAHKGAQPPAPQTRRRHNRGPGAEPQVSTGKIANTAAVALSLPPRLKAEHTNILASPSADLHLLNLPTSPP